MLCQECKQNQANTHFTVVENGVRKEYDLCSQCAQKHGLMAFSPFSFGDLFSKSLGMSGYGNELQCSHCGTTLNELKQTSHLGCEHCYEDLFPGIEPILRSVQRGLNHTGRIPLNRPDSLQSGGAQKKEDEPLSPLQQLQKELDEAVCQEAFERAAELRDKIKALKEGEGEA